MAIEEVAIIAFSFVSCIAICALAYFKSMERQEQIRQVGITQRATMKIGMPGEATSAMGGQWAWLVPIATELLKVPAVQNIVAEKLTAIASTAVKQS
jgi:hypothetical protein